MQQNHWFSAPQIQSWWLLCLATAITITITTASQLFTNRIGLLLDQQASELLASDLLIRSSEQIDERYEQQAKQLGLATARTVTLRTAIFIDDEPQLVELKAVSSGYPLRGTLERKKDLLGEPEVVAQGPVDGTIWLDSKLATLVGNAIDIGRKSLDATWIVSYEPDRGGSLFNLAPRIMMPFQQLHETGLLVPGSRAKYALLVAGSTQQIKQYETLIQSQLLPGERLETLHNARPEMRSALDRTRKFFALSIVLTLVIAMIAIAITARYAASRESVRVAVMRSFGVSSLRLLQHYLFQLLKIWLLAAILGSVAGHTAQFPLQWVLGNWFGASLPEAEITPYLLGSMVGLIALSGFSLPSIFNVLETPPMRVLRQGVQNLSRGRLLLLTVVSLAALFIILLLLLEQWTMAVMVFGLILALALIVPLLIRGLILLLQSFSGQHFWWLRYVTSRMLYSSRNALFVLSGFSVTLLAVLIISLVKDQLIDEWTAQLPEDKPNYFLVNIDRRDVASVEQFLTDQSIPSSQAYALVRARLIAINDQPVGEIKFESSRAEGLINHVFNMSYSDELPPDNEITLGAWQKQNNGFSVEQGMAESLNLKLGDRMQFSVQGELFEEQITSLRSVVWENFRPNFFVLADKSLLEPKPQTWLLSAYLSTENRRLLKPLLQQFPSITLLDISEVMLRIKGIVDRASAALEFFFVFALVSAVLVLLSALNTARPIREREIALLQALGATQKQKLISQLMEFVLSGLIVGLFAAAIATAVGGFVAVYYFGLSFSVSLALWVYSLISATLLITVLGLLFVYPGFSSSPIRLLRS